jgi:hypothetical protein
MVPHGMALFGFGEAQPNLTGVLVDASDGGFRVRHPFPGFQKDAVVLFIHPLCEGTARVVWTSAAAEDFETGFKYLSASPTD